MKNARDILRKKLIDMRKDPIVEEIHKTHKQIVREYDYDLNRIIEAQLQLRIARSIRGENETCRKKNL